VTEISVIEASFFTITAFLIIGIFIVVILLWRYAMGRHSYIFLEAISPVDCLQLCICKLPIATRNFALVHGKISLQIQQLGCIGIAHINGNVALTNSFTHQPIQMPTTLCMTSSKAARVKGIISHPQKQLAFLACHSYETVPLRANAVETMTNLQELQYVEQHVRSGEVTAYNYV
jgi:hypothetical protein